MSDKPFWNDDWVEIQRKYWEGWSEMSGRALGGEAAAVKTWEQALDHWWQAVSPAAPALAHDFMGRMMEQGKQLFRLAESFQNANPGEAQLGDWSETLSRLSAEVQRALTGAGEGRAPGMMGFRELPLHSWQTLVSSFSNLPGGLPKGISTGGSGFDPERFLSAPGLGYSREIQAKQQELIRLVGEYQKAYADYSDFFSNLGERSIERLRSRLEEYRKAGEVIDTARSLYDNWVVTCEEVYAERVKTADYARIQGRLINALIRVKRQFGILVDDQLGALNMPTRRELRTLQDRIQDNRREIRWLHARVQSLTEKSEAVAAPQKKVVQKRAPGAVKKRVAAVGRKVIAGKKAVTGKKPVTRKKEGR
jgi:class III poly(R)-hydroxyalkanoic acid synthase PhaE subunit